MTVEGARYQLRNRVTEDGRPLYMRIETDGPRMRYVLADEADIIIRSRYVEPGKVSRMDITNFLTEYGWPTLSFDAFDKLCIETGTEYDTSQKSFVMDVGDAKRLLSFLQKTPFVDPLAELSISSIATAIGHPTSSQLMKVLNKRVDFYTPFLRQRRRGIQPMAYRQVQALTITGSRNLLRDAIEISPTLQRALGRTGMISSLVTKLQQDMQKLYWVRKMDPNLNDNAINNFLARFLPGTQSSETTLTSVTTPAEFDESYTLTHSDREWRTLTACNDKNAALFLADDGRPGGERKIQEAKEICSGCAVKGNCLLFSLEHKQEGVAGGFTEQERSRLSPNAAQWLQNSRQTQ